MSQQATHKADGLFSVTLNQVRKATASELRLSGWRAELPKDGTDDTPITITLERLRRVQLIARTLGSLSQLMESHKKIDKGMQKSFSESYLKAKTLDEEATIFMDLLYRRARREGRVQ